MGSFFKSLAVAASVLPLVLAAPQPAGGHMQCYTQIANKKPDHCKTTTHTRTTPCTKSTTLTRTSTSTPKACTTTVTTSTTETVTAPASVSTSTVSTTTTFSTASTSTTTVVTTSTSTENIVATSTVPTSDLFVAVQTSLPGSTYDGTGGGSPVEKRDINDTIVDRGIPVSNLLERGVEKRGMSKKTYPKSVECYKHVKSAKCSTATKYTTKTVIAPKPSTSTVKKTSTITTTYVPSATTTITTTISTTTTSTEVATTTSTASTTVTSATSTTSVYAACATNNFADYYLGQGIYNVPAQNVGYTNADASTPYDCCVAAFTYPGQGFVAGWAQSITDTYSYACYLGISTDTCAAGQLSHPIPVETEGDMTTPADIVIGNANCGIHNSIYNPLD